jgi:hypothetical protein
VLLAVPDELSLHSLCAEAIAAGLRLACFHEPDLGGALTAAALEPAGRRLVARLPLALAADRPAAARRTPARLRTPRRTPARLRTPRRTPARLLTRRGGETMTAHSSDPALRAQLAELTAERDALRAQLAGDLPAATRWLQRKVWRQAAALDALNRRAVSQRFVLRTLDGLGRSLSAAEYRAARDRVADVQLRARIEDPDAA